MDIKQRQLVTLQKEIDQLREAHQQAFAECDHLIKKKKDELETLTKECSKAQGFVHLYSESARSMQDKIKEIEKEYEAIKERATEEVAEIYADAHKRIEAVIDREENVQNREKQLLRDQEALIKERELIEDEKKRLLSEEEESQKKVDALIKEYQIVSKELAKSKQIRDDRDVEIQQKIRELNKVTKDVIDKQWEEAQVDAKNAQEREAQEVLKKTLAIEKGILMKKKEALTRKELLLLDKEKTLARSHAELRRKGVLLP